MSVFFFKTCFRIIGPDHFFAHHSCSERLIFVKAKSQLGLFSTLIYWCYTRVVSISTYSTYSISTYLISTYSKWDSFECYDYIRVWKANIGTHMWYLVTKGIFLHLGLIWCLYINPGISTRIWTENSCLPLHIRFLGSHEMTNRACLSSLPLDQPMVEPCYRVCIWNGVDRKILHRRQ